MKRQNGSKLRPSDFTRVQRGALPLTATSAWLPCPRPAGSAQCTLTTSSWRAGQTGLLLWYLSCWNLCSLRQFLVNGRDWLCDWSYWGQEVDLLETFQYKKTVGNRDPLKAQPASYPLMSWLQLLCPLMSWLYNCRRSSGSAATTDKRSFSD